MIGKLRGRVDDIGPDWVIIDIGGVGYEVHCSPRTLAALPARGEMAELYIETHMRENGLRLFAFTSQNERQWFRNLQTVQGVGAKVALAVLGVMGPEELAGAIAIADKAAITRAPGVGPKVAQRLIAELRDKAREQAGDMGMPPAGAHPDAAGSQGGDAGADMAARDAISALVNLGYSQEKAAKVVGASVKNAGPEAGSRELIRLALKALAGQ